MTKILITTIQVNFGAGGGNTNLPELLLLKFLPLSDNHSHFWAATFDFTTFFMLPFFCMGRTFLYSLAVLCRQCIPKGVNFYRYWYGIHMVLSQSTEVTLTSCYVNFCLHNSNSYQNFLCFAPNCTCALQNNVLHMLTKKNHFFSQII